MCRLEISKHRDSPKRTLTSAKILIMYSRSNRFDKYFSNSISTAVTSINRRILSSRPSYPYRRSALCNESVSQGKYCQIIFCWCSIGHGRRKTLFNISCVVVGGRESHEFISSLIFQMVCSIFAFAVAPRRKPKKNSHKTSACLWFGKNGFE